MVSGCVWAGALQPPELPASKTGRRLLRTLQAAVASAAAAAAAAKTG